MTTMDQPPSFRTGPTHPLMPLVHPSQYRPQARHAYRFLSVSTSPRPSSEYFLLVSSFSACAIPSTSNAAPALLIPRVHISCVRHCLTVDLPRSLTPIPSIDR